MSERESSAIIGRDTEPMHQTARFPGRVAKGRQGEARRRKQRPREIESVREGERECVCVRETKCVCVWERERAAIVPFS